MQLIVAEKSRPSQDVQRGCLCVNPGSFATSDFSFATVYPLRARADLW